MEQLKSVLAELQSQLEKSKQLNASFDSFSNHFRDGMEEGLGIAIDLLQKTLSQPILSETKHSTSMTVLFSKPTMRVIWHNGNASVTAQLTPEFEFSHYIHQAPIGIWEMAFAFSNQEETAEGVTPCTTWEQRDITEWRELAQG